MPDDQQLDPRPSKALMAHITDSLVPHEGNKYLPTLLQARGMLATIAVVVFLFIGASVTQRALVSGSDFFAAVITGVLVDLANTDRAFNGLGILTPSPTLAYAAQLKAEDMAAKGYFAHTSPEGVSPWHWFKQANYGFLYAGENLAVHFSDSADVERAWMNSPTHRANILNSQFTEIGIATAKGYYQGRETIFVVQLFGTPKVAKAPVAETRSQTLISTTIPVAEIPASESDVVVAGESTSTPVQEEPAVAAAEPETIVETEEFIAVKDAAALAAVSPATSAPVDPVRAFLMRLVTSPTTVLNWAYFAFAVLLIAVLLLTIAIEVKLQHPKNLALGAGALALMALLLFVLKGFASGALLVV
jgi:hypothetical protein